MSHLTHLDESHMEPFLIAVVCIAALAILDALSIAFGADSRDGFRETDLEPALRRGF
jgi:hypothetical protein